MALSEVAAAAAPADRAQAESDALAAFQVWQEARHMAKRARESHQIEGVAPAAVTPPAAAAATAVAIATPELALRVADASAMSGGSSAARSPLVSSPSGRGFGQASPASRMIARLRRAPPPVPLANLDAMAPAAGSPHSPSAHRAPAPASPSRRLGVRARTPHPADESEAAVDAERPRVGCCFKMCCLLACNFWLLLLALSATAPSILFAQHFPANEIDYWYRARLCPRETGGGAPTFEQYTPLADVPPSLACNTPTNVTSCDGPTCAARGCAGAGTASECRECCAGSLHNISAPCAFPFIIDTALGEPHTHRSCVSVRTTAGGTGASAGGTGGGWCPTALDASGWPLGWPRRSGGMCSASCKQANFVGAAAEACGALSCATGGTSPSSQEISIGADGWNGPPGFQFGGRYTLVAFSRSDYLTADIELHNARGKRLALATIAPHRCTATAISSVDTNADASLRRSLQRRQGLFDSLTGGEGPEGLRERDGEGARWDGVPPMRTSADVMCARDVVPVGTRILLGSGGCEAGEAGELRTAHPMDRMEIGEPFVLDEDDLPLSVRVRALDASIRGRLEEHSADGNAMVVESQVAREDDAPELYFTLWAAEIDAAPRTALTATIPIGYLLLSCCVCVGCYACASWHRSSAAQRQVLPMRRGLKGGRDGTEPPSTPRPRAEGGWSTPRMALYAEDDPAAAAVGRRSRVMAVVTPLADRVVSNTRHLVSDVAMSMAPALATPLATRFARARDPSMYSATP